MNADWTQWNSFVLIHCDNLLIQNCILQLLLNQTLFQYCLIRAKMNVWLIVGELNDGRDIIQRDSVNVEDILKLLITGCQFNCTFQANFQVCFQTCVVPSLASHQDNSKNINGKRKGIVNYNKINNIDCHVLDWLRYWLTSHVAVVKSNLSQYVSAEINT